MRYWTGLLIAVAFDAAVIAGPSVLGPESPPAQSQTILLPGASEPDYDPPPAYHPNGSESSPQWPNTLAWCPAALGHSIVGRRHC